MQLPFSEQAFLDLFGVFNRATWPALVLLWIATAWVTAGWLRGRANAVQLAAVTAAHWGWSGIVYHGMFFTRINPAATLFAILFVAQATLLVVFGIQKRRLVFDSTPSARRVTAIVFVGYSFLYPLLVLATGHELPRAPLFGVPCPTTIFTAGILLAAAHPPRVLFVIPIAWAIVGASASLLLGVAPDLMLIAAVVALVFFEVASVLHVDGPAVRHRSIRATANERRRELPGDLRIFEPLATLTHAITIHARPASVWPWLAQMGAGSRGGWYSYDGLDNGGHPSATTIHPDLQHIAEGSLFPALPGETSGFTALEVTPERSLVLGWSDPKGYAIVTWAFVLEPHDTYATRLIVRARGSQAYRFRGLPRWLSVPLARCVHYTMVRRQLLGIAARVESLREASLAMPPVLQRGSV